MKLQIDQTENRRETEKESARMRAKTGETEKGRAIGRTKGMGAREREIERERKRRERYRKQINFYIPYFVLLLFYFNYLPSRMWDLHPLGT